MWIVYLIITVYILKKFNEPISKTLGLANKTVDIADDSLQTYGNEVSVANAEKRLEQKQKIDSFDEIVTNEEIEALLHKKATKTETRPLASAE